MSIFSINNWKIWTHKKIERTLAWILIYLGFNEKNKSSHADLPTYPNEHAPDNLARLIRELSFLHGCDNKHDASTTNEHFEGPEALADFAAKQNFDVIFENSLVSSLKTSDFPAVVLTRSGLGRMLLSKNENDFFARGSSGEYVISLEQLKKEEIGTIFLLKVRSIVDNSEKSSEKGAGVSSVFTLKENEDPFQQVLLYMTTYQRRGLINILIAAAFSNMMLLAIPIYTGLIFDRVIPHSAFDTLWAISIGVFLALIADIAMRWVRIKLQDSLASNASAGLQAAFMRSLLSIKLSEAPRSSSSVSQRLQQIDELSQLIPQWIAGVCIDAPFILVVISIIWMNGGAAVFVPFFGMIFIFALHHFIKIASKDENVKAMRLQQMQTNSIIEAVEGLETIKSTCTERRFLGKFERCYDEFAYSSHMVRLWSGISAYMSAAIGQMMIVMVTLVGVYQISLGNMTVGGLSSCIFLVGRVISPISQLVSVIHKVSQNRKIFQALSRDLKGEGEGLGDTSSTLSFPQKADISFLNVSFSYLEQTTKQVENISITIQNGERIGVIGRSGSGKSTFLKLIPRLLDPVVGSVMIGGFDARQYQANILRQNIGYMGQVPGLMDDTLLANITLGNSSYSPEKIQEITNMCGITEFVSKHSQGFSMRIGSRGERLSGGERQAVALARLLLSNPEVIVLDEPTASMDTMLEMKLTRELHNCIAGKTLILATHRAPLLQLVDRLLLFENGKIVADGPKDEVLRRLSGNAA